MKAADLRLYDAKAAGRNRTVGPRDAAWSDAAAA
jgi:PleD family two-component response regulator